MLDFGMAELLVILVVMIFVVGPQDLPGLMQGIGRFVRRLLYMKHAIAMQVDEMMGTVDPHEVNAVMQKKMVVPEVNPEDEAEFLEDEVFDPRPKPPLQTKEAEDDPLSRDQQDLFEGPQK